MLKKAEDNWSWRSPHMWISLSCWVLWTSNSTKVPKMPLLQVRSFLCSKAIELSSKKYHKSCATMRKPLLSSRYYSISCLHTKLLSRCGVVASLHSHFSVLSLSGQLTVLSSIPSSISCKTEILYLRDGMAYLLVVLCPNCFDRQNQKGKRPCL
jgi:hypothetical protein